MSNTSKKTSLKSESSSKNAPKKKLSKQNNKSKSPSWTSIHILGTGEIHIAHGKESGDVPIKDVKAIVPFLKALVKVQQKGTNVEMSDTRVIDIFRDSHIQFSPRSSRNKAQRFEWNDVKVNILSNLAMEVDSLLSSSIQSKNEKLNHFLSLDS